MVAYVMWLLIVLTPSGVPVVVWNHDSEQECVQAGQRYRTFACVRLVVKATDFRK